MARNPKFDVLAPFASIYAGAFGMVRTLTDDELQDFITACEQVTETNCWWAEFHAAKALESEARNQQRLRGLP